MAYIGKSPTGAGVRSRFHFTATGGETSLSGADDNGKTLVFADGEYVDVYLNGVLLFDGDYNTTTANTIGGLDALTTSDVVEIVVYDIFSVADTVSAKNGGTFSGNVGIGATSPDIALNIEGTGNELLRLRDTNGTNVSMSLYTDNTNTGSRNWMVGGNLYNYGDFNIVSSTSNTGDPDVTNATRFTIDSSGNVGIGTNSPAKTLDVNVSSATFRVRNAGGGNDFSFKTTAGPVSVVGCEANTHLGFMTNDTERMRIMSDGIMRIGQTATDNPGAGNTTTGVGIQQNGRIHASADGTWSSFNRNNENGTLLNFYRSGVGVGDISVTTSSTSYNTSSDHRLKENVETMSGAITRVKSLKPKRFSWIVDDEDAATVDGFLAHEAQSVVPEAVTGTHNEVDDDGNPVYQAIDQSKLVPLLTGALQEAITKIETLETEMTALKARVTALENA